MKIRINVLTHSHTVVQKIHHTETKHNKNPIDGKL